MKLLSIDIEYLLKNIISILYFNLGEFNKMNS